MRTPFVGRGDELALLNGALDRARSSGLELVVLEGAAGVGKTAVSERFLDSAAVDGADVLHTRSYQSRSRLPHSTLTGLFRPRVEAEHAPDDLLSDVWLSQLSRLLPELCDRYPDLDSPSQDQGSAQHVFEAIARLGAALAERAPVLILVDDVHWADSASLEALSYAAQRWAEQRAAVVLIATLRPEALVSSGPLTAWLDELARATNTTRHRLQPLSAQETLQLASAMGGRDVGDWLFARTGGHPLLVTETIKALGLDDPSHGDPQPAATDDQPARVDDRLLRDRVLPALRGVAETWLTQISDTAATVVTAASVLAEDTSPDRIRRLTDLSESEIASALDELVAVQLLEGGPRAQGGNYRFSHDLVRELIAEIAGPEQRRLLHRSALDVLRNDGASAARLVGHAVIAGSPDEAFDLSLTAAHDAMEELAAGVAAEHFAAARSIADEHGWPASSTSSDRVGLLLGLGRALELTEQTDAAERTYRSALELAEQAGLAELERRTLIRLGQMSFHTTDPERRAGGTAMLRRAKDIALELGDLRSIAEADIELASIAYHGGDLAGAELLLEQAVEGRADVLDRRLRARRSTMLSLLNISHRRWPEAAIAAAQAAELYEDDPILAHDARRSGAYCLLQSGRPKEALELIESAYEFSREIGNLWGETECLWKLGHVHLELGNYGLARQFAEAGVEHAQRLGVPPFLELALAVLATVQRTTLDLHAARSTIVDELVPLIEEMGGVSLTEDWSATEMCTIARLTGDWDLAAEYAAKRPSLRRDPSLLTLGLTPWDAIEALLRSGNDAEARAELGRLDASAAGNPRFQLVLHRSKAALANWEGDADRAIEELRAALDVARQLGLPGEEWPILCALAKAHGVDVDAEATALVAHARAVVARLAATIDSNDVRERFTAGAEALVA